MLPLALAEIGPNLKAVLPPDPSSVALDRAQNFEPFLTFITSNPDEQRNDCMH